MSALLGNFFEQIVHKLCCQTPAQLQLHLLVEVTASPDGKEAENLLCLGEIGLIYS